ncbi:MAG TPA: SDR family NAD(P)-dependent oxidoreductase, partial [Rhabdaerophilum sp.]|nr:SDR family NAD(P)-dependent oxidoreductase [Rhabdaerophilum sp.]
MAGPVTIVTGASGGIGSALCRVLAGAGHRLVLTALDAEGLAAIADEVAAAGGEAAVLPGDMRDRALPEALVALAVTRFGSL